MRKYLEAKARERDTEEAKRQKNLAKMALKELVVASPGKKKMVRSNVPLVTKAENILKQEDKDPDLTRYFGTDVDITLIPDEESIQEQEEVAEEVEDPFDFW